ncbi:MAG: hypothetical protein ABIR87_06310 [Sphingomicrobium sp.]
MTPLTLTLMLSFTLGCLTSIAGEQANRTFSDNTVGGAVLYVVALLAAFGASLFAMATVGNMLGTYPLEVDRPILSFAAGFAVFALFNRIRSSCR